MPLTRERVLALSLLLTVLLVNGFGLRAELEVSRVDQNDNASHYPLIARMVQVVEHGGNPLDFLCPEWSLGYPMLRTYQPLAHSMVALAYFALGKAASVMTVFVWVRYLSVVLLPLSFFAAAWLMDLGPLTAAAAALLAPLVSTNLLYGIEYESYVWAGWGLFPQSVACHFLLWTLGLAFRAIHKGRPLTLTGALLGLTMVTHLIYGYIGALSICLLVAIPNAAAPLRLRVRRIVWIGSVSALVSAFQLAPLALDHAIINHSRLEAAWKWDSYGAGQVLEFLFTGQLLDHGRLPVLSLLSLSGLVVYILELRGIHRFGRAHAFALLGAAAWILILFGRPFWGPALFLIGVSPDMHLHRVIGAAQLFLVLLAAMALTTLWRILARRAHVAVAAVATAVLLYPMMRERAGYLATNDRNGHANLQAYAAAKGALDSTIAQARERGGRVYAGMAWNWGPSFRIGYTPMYAFLSESQVPEVAYLYHTMALTADVMSRFNDGDPTQYRLFNIRTFILPARYTLPPFLTLRGSTAEFQVFDTPANGYFDVVDVPASVGVNKDTFFAVNDRWMQSDWRINSQYLLLDLPDVRHPSIVPALPRLDASASLPVAPSARPAGVVASESQEGETYRAKLEAQRPAFALFRMTWHPGWKVYVDGKAVESVMLSPGFVGTPVAAGSHQIQCRYEPGWWKVWMALGGLIATAIVAIAERRFRSDAFGFTGPCRARG